MAANIKKTARALEDEKSEALRLLACHQGTERHDESDLTPGNAPLKTRREVVYLVGTSTRTRGGIGYVIKTYFDSVLAEDYELVHVVTHCDGNKLKKMWQFFSAFWCFVLSVIVYRGRIVHIHSSSGPSFLRKVVFVFVARLLARSVIFHIHSGLIRQYYEESGRIVRWMLRWVLRSVDMIIVLTRQWEQEIRQIEEHCARIRVVGNPVDLSKYRRAQTQTKSSGARLLFLGAIMKEKGVYDIIDSVARLVGEGWDISMTFAGDREIENARKTCRERGLQERVRFVGWVEEPEKLDLLRETDVLLLPSYAEGLPLCVLEAMACGVPVICSAVGGLTDLIRNDVNGLLVKPGDRQQLTEAIRRLLGEADLRERLAPAARETVEHEYDLNVVATTLNSIYSDVKR